MCPETGAGRKDLVSRCMKGQQYRLWGINAQRIYWERVRHEKAHIRQTSISDDFVISSNHNENVYSNESLVRINKNSCVIVFQHGLALWSLLATLHQGG